MKNIKIVFFDVDGTLISYPECVVPDSTRLALDELKKKGIKVFYATGRSKQVLSQLTALQGVKMDGMVTLNGSLTLIDDEIIDGNPLSMKDIEIVEEYAKNNGIPLQYIDKDETYIDFIDDSVREALGSVHTCLPPTKAFDRQKDIYQMILYADKLACKQLEPNLFHAKMTNWYESAIDIVRKDAGKGRGIQQVLKYYGFDKSEAVAFGDGENDVELFESVGHSFAVDNATDHLKSIADDVSEPLMEGGIYKLLKKHEIL